MSNYEKFMHIISDNLNAGEYDEVKRKRIYDTIAAKYKDSELFQDVLCVTEDDSEFLIGETKQNIFGENGFEGLDGLPRHERVEWLSHCYENVAEKVFYIYKNPIDIKGRFGRTELHEAVLSSDFGLVSSLIKNGAQTDIRDNGGCTPLMLACLDENNKMVAWLNLLGGE